MSEEKTVPVITISREYGAGGRTIAKGLAKKFDIPWYDRDFVQKTASTSGFSVEDISAEGEQISRSGRFLNNVLGNAAVYPSSYDRIFEAQKEVILELSKSPCIIVGRCANHILHKAGIPVFSVFLYADPEKRLKRAMELGENGDMEIRKYMEKVDSRRRNYYANYTHHEIDDCHEYDLCLNSGIMTMDENVALIAEMIENLSQS